MERSMPENVLSTHKRLSVSFIVSLMVRCARHASRVSKKLKLKSTRKRARLEDYLESPTAKNKANHEGGGGNTAAIEMVEEEEYGIWQREILMGGKCEPLDYSGVIYYDCSGHQLKELPPRSPRASLVPDRPTRSYVGSPLNPTGNEI